MNRPQPIDLQPWPLGGLMTPDSEAGEAYREAAMRGDSDAAALGPRFIRCAAQDDIAGALEALDAAEGEADVLAFDRFVLEPSAQRLEQLRGELDGLLAELLELVAYRAGLRADLPQFELLRGELLAAARASEASVAIEAGELERARDLLVEAIEHAREASPGLAAQLTLSLVEVENSRGEGPERRAELLRSARALLDGHGFPTLVGEIALELGVLLQEEGGSLVGAGEVAALLQEATRSLDPQLHRRAHGFAQMRLGLAYLSMPMRDASDALRMGVAVRGLQEAVRVLQPEEDRDLWVTAAINLGNALQLLPSDHLERNLDRAVTLYDRALELRSVEEDPAGHARILLNKAQAAASLNRRQEAIEALTGACPVLQRLGLTDELQAARAMREDLKRAEVVGGQGA